MTIKTLNYGWITLDKEKYFLFLENLRLIKKLYDNISNSPYFFFPIHKFVNSRLNFFVQIPAWSGLE